jgi:GT2 family glycosyltransferase
MGGIFNPRSGQKYLYASGLKDTNDNDQPVLADWLPGMGTIIHKSVFERIGFLDVKRFPQYHGDSDFTFRAKLEGFQIKVFPQLKIFNDTSNSGIRHNDNFKKLVDSLTSIKSNYNLKKEFLFYKLYSKGACAYWVPIKRYFKYIAGFTKWKILGLFGIVRTK